MMDILVVVLRVVEEVIEEVIFKVEVYGDSLVWFFLFFLGEVWVGFWLLGENVDC